MKKPRSIIEVSKNAKGVAAALAEAGQIQEVARKLAKRIGLDTADGVLLERPNLMFLFMIENLLDRIELLEEVYPQIVEAQDSVGDKD